MSKINFRLEEKQDYRKVEELVRNSFWNVYCPGAKEHYVLNKFRSRDDFVKELDYVMELDDEIIGQNIFVKASVKTDDGAFLPILSMGPICIKNELKRKGYGKQLLDYTLEKAKDLGYGAVMFEGNIDFYGKSGFTTASTFGIRYPDFPEDESANFFLCKELIPGYLDDITGVYVPSDGYLVADLDPEGFESYDATFPPKEKLKLPGQLF